MKKNILLSAFFLVFFGSFAQENTAMDFTRLKAEITIIPFEKKVTGVLNFSFDVSEEADSLYIDARKMQFSDVFVNGKETEFYNDGRRLWIISNLEKSTQNELQLSYTAYPRQAMYFIQTAGPDEYQVWTQGQGKYTSHWLPPPGRQIG